MIPKRVLVPDRVRRPPPTGWSWVDRRFVREHMAYLSREATLLYFILCAVADKHGMSFYGDGTRSILSTKLPTPKAAAPASSLSRPLHLLPAVSARTASCRRSYSGFSRSTPPRGCRRRT
jgi:hypothetical protein